MSDGPALRIRMHQSKVAAEDAARRVHDLKDKHHSPVWWIRWDAKLRLPFALARKRKHENRGRKAKLRLMSMALG